MADLKNENPKAVEFFKNRGREYFELREDLRDLQISEQDLGDLPIEQIRRIGGMVQKRFEQGGVDAVNQVMSKWEKQATILKKSLLDEHTPTKDLPDIQLNLDTAETMLNLVSMFKKILVKIDESKQIVTAIGDTFQDMCQDVLTSIKRQNGNSIISSINSLKEGVDKYIAAYENYESAAEAYYQATLEDFPKLGKAPISRTVAEELYLELSKAINDAKKAQADNPDKASSIERTVVSLEEGIECLEILLPEELVNELRAKRNALSTPSQTTEPPKVTTTPVPPKITPEPGASKNTTDEFKEKIEASYQKIYEAVIEKFSSADWNKDKQLAAIKEHDNLLFNEYKDIPLKEKVTIDNGIHVSFEEKLNDYYGVDLYATLVTIESITKQIDAVNKMKVEDKSLKPLVNALMNNIDLLKKSKFAKKGGMTVNQGDNDLEIRFANVKVHDRKFSILRPELYDKIHQTAQPTRTTVEPGTKPEQTTVPETVPETKPEQTTEPEVEPETKPEEKPVVTTETEEKDIQFYLDLLRETNAKVAEINRINQELVFNNMFSELSMANILHDVNVESTAVYESAIVTKLRLELSNKRYDYLKKYGKYILSNPELRDAKIEEIKFETEFEEFLRKRDELIVDTELRIKELNEKKPEGYEAEIKNLLEFIKAQNSLIKRFLIAESVSRKIDIAAVLSERNERRKAILEAKLKGKEPEVEPGTEPEQPTGPEVEPETKPEQHTEPEIEPGTEPEQPTGPEVEPGTEPEQPTGPEVEPGTEPEQPTEPEQKPEEFTPVPKGTEIPHVLVKETALQFNPRNNRGIAKTISANDRLFDNMPKVTTTLIKNGVRIELSKQLRERLAELSAKISLVNKDNRRVRTSRLVDADSESQEITFQKDHDVNFDDYTVEVRIPGESRSRVLFGDEEVQRRSR